MKVVLAGRGREAVVARHATPNPEPRMDIKKNARTTEQSEVLAVQPWANAEAELRQSGLDLLSWA